MKKLRSKFKSLSLYRKSLLVFSFILFLMSLFILNHVYSSLLLYDEYEINNYMENLTDDIEEAIKYDNFNLYGIDKYTINPYEVESNVAEAIRNYVGNKDLCYKKTNKDNVYTINLDDKELFKVTLNDKEKITRLSLLTITKWKVKDIKVEDKEGIYQVDIYAPSNYKVLVNNKHISSDDIKERESIEHMEDAYLYANLPYNNHYRITNLTKIPEVKILDEYNNEVEVENNNNTYKVKSNLKTKEDILNEINPIVIAENWSLFMSNDTSIQSIYPYLIPNTLMYNKARTWANGIDHTFTAAHVLGVPPFENEEIENIEIYNDQSFRADIKLTKNLRLIKNNQIKKIEMHESLYFVKYEGSFKLINMISL